MRRKLRNILIGGAGLLMAGACGAVVHDQASQPASAQSGGGAGNERVVEIAVKKFEYIPSEVTLKKGQPVRLELTSLDRLHGFDLPDLGIRADVKPDETAVLHLVPQKTGQFVFHCDIFCGDGHEDLQGVITVVE
ncbi:MAG TPA: cupredoxin domain-containing protein [Candidatus Sulfotelmatobacter sp.]|nr:cupredoxin domain-containing protein [Candidatus Sulfotelmatobacter sp.]